MADAAPKTAWAVIPKLEEDLDVQSLHGQFVSSETLAGMLGKPPQKVVDLAANNRSDECTGGLYAITRV